MRNLLLFLAMMEPALGVELAGTDVHNFHPAALDGDLRDPLRVDRPGALSQGDRFVAGLTEMAKAPLVLAETDPLTGDTTRATAVDNLTVLMLSAGIAPHERIRLDLLAPMFLAHTDAARALAAPAMGDLRTSAQVLALSPARSGVGLGVGGWLDLPTGAEGRMLGLARLAGGGELSATYELSRLTLSADLGIQRNPRIDLMNVLGADTLLAGLAVGVLATDAVGLTAEVSAASPWVANQVPGTGAPVEALLHVRHRMDSGAFLTAGTGAGLTSSVGVAQYRLFLGGGWGRIHESADEELCADGSLAMPGLGVEDGCRVGYTLLATLDGAPYPAWIRLAEPSGSRERDVGAEGWAMAALPGAELTALATAEGCLRGQAAFVVQADHAVFSVPLSHHLDASLEVVVVDGAGSPVPNASVSWVGDAACRGALAQSGPGRFGVAVAAGLQSFEVAAPGFAARSGTVEVAAHAHKELLLTLESTRVVVEQEAILILDKIHFETGRAVIQPRSFPILDAVTSVLAQHTRITLVEVAGHTDNQGSDAYNLELSDRRAHAVLNHLVDNGVAPERLTARGAGEREAVARNDTAQGREQNRRVAFTIVRQGGE